ncbi:MAG: DUF6089 family protein [Bacteroidales bacterium]|nr:DUF6089 family protein [Bacteroidales bacterium]
MGSVKYIIAGLSCLFCLHSASGEDFRVRTDFGVSGGVSYYLGDINPRRQFYSPGISAGLLMKHHFGEHHALRANVTYGQLKGDDMDFKNDFQQQRGLKFETSLVDAHVGYEFHFLPYTSTGRTSSAHTPYIFAGVGYSFIVTSTVRNISSGHVTIPFGVGYKHRFNSNISAGCEWGLRKTFTDEPDGIPNHGIDGSFSTWHNNDWYSFVGIFITFRIFEESFECPAYKQPFGYK